MTVDRLKDALDSGIPGCAWIVRLDAAGRAEPGDAADLARVGGAPDGFFWLHFDRTDARAADIFAAVPVLTDDARAALTGAIDHQFVEHGGRVVSGAIVDHEFSLDGPRYDTDFLRFVVGPGFLFTSRRTPLYSAQATRRALADGAMAATPGALFELLIGNVCECSARMTREIAMALDRIEDNVVLEGRGRDQRGPLGARRREAVRLARQINGLQSTLHRLEEATEAPEHLDLAEIAASLAQRADGLARDVANLLDRARVLQEEINSILTLETNDRLYLLTVITALLLPATLVTGYFGMNTKNLVFSESDNGTLYATLICVAASTATLLLLKRLGLTEPGATKQDKSEKA